MEYSRIHIQVWEKPILNFTWPFVSEATHQHSPIFLPKIRELQNTSNAMTPPSEFQNSF